MDCEERQRLSQLGRCLRHGRPRRCRWGSRRRAGAGAPPVRTYFVEITSMNVRSPWPFSAMAFGWA